MAKLIRFCTIDPLSTMVQCTMTNIHEKGSTFYTGFWDQCDTCKCTLCPTANLARVNLNCLERMWAMRLARLLLRWTLQKYYWVRRMSEHSWMGDNVFTIYWWKHCRMPMMHFAKAPTDQECPWQYRLAIFYLHT